MLHTLSKQFILVGFMLFTAYQLLAHGVGGMADDPGLGWHLQLGEEILNSGSLPAYDHFLANPLPEQVIHNQWLSDVFLAAMYHAGSWQSIYAVCLSLFFITIWCLLFCSAVFLSESLVVALTFTLCSFAMLQMHFIIRPVLVQATFLGCLCLLLLIGYQRFRDIGTVARGQLFTVFVIFALWANMHPSFVVGLLLCGLLVFSMFVDAWLAGTRLTGIRVWNALSFPLLALAGSLCTPYGPSLHHSIYRYMQMDYTRVQSEWLPPAPGSVEQLILLTITAVFATTVFLARKQIKSTGVFPILLPLPFLCAGFFVVRYAPIASILFLFSASYLLNPVLQRVFPGLADDEATCRRLFRTAFVTAACILTATSIYTIGNGSLPFYAGTYGPTKTTFPYEAVAWARLQQAESKNAEPLEILNHPNWGGFIILHGFPALKPLLDDRNYLIDREYLMDALRFFRTPEHALLNRLLRDETDLLLFPVRSHAGRWVLKEFSDAVAYQDEITVAVSASTLKSR